MNSIKPGQRFRILSEKIHWGSPESGREFIIIAITKDLIVFYNAIDLSGYCKKEQFWVWLTTGMIRLIPSEYLN
jgi:hypothetical protein